MEAALLVPEHMAGLDPCVLLPCCLFKQPASPSLVQKGVIVKVCSLITGLHRHHICLCPISVCLVWCG